MTTSELKTATVKKTENDGYILPVLIILFELFLIFISNSKLAGEDDLFWYLSTGRYIVQTGNVPSSDVFGFTTSGMKWIPFEWGWDVINYILFNSGEYFALSIFSTLIILLIFYLLFLILKNQNVNYFLIFLFLLILGLGICTRLTIKPHLFTYLSLVLLLTIIIKYRYHDKSRFSTLYFIPLVFLLWINMHMGVLNGFLLLGLFFISEFTASLFSNYFSGRSTGLLSKKELTLLAAVFCASVLITLINPHGFKTYEYAFSVVSLKQLEMIYEWQSPFSGLYLTTFVNFFYYFFIFCLIPIVYYSFKKKDIFPAFLCIGFFINSLNAARLTIDFMLVTSVFAAISVQFIIENIKNKNFSGILRTNPFPKIILSVIILVIIVFIPGDRFYGAFGIKRSLGTGIDNNNFPVRMFGFMKKTGIDSIGTRPFNTYETGGFFVWNFQGRKNFIGSRSLSDDLWNDYISIINIEPGFSQKIDSIGFDYFMWMVPILNYAQNPALLDHGILSYLFNEESEWKLVYWDDISFLFVKNEERFSQIISQFEYKYFTPYNFYFHLEVIRQAFLTDRQIIMAEIERKNREDPRGVFTKTMVNHFKGNLIQE